MRVFKFGGASVKNADGVKNVLKIIEQGGNAGKVVVVSAMGKMTNALEEVVEAYFINPNQLDYSIEIFQNFHRQILQGLFDESHSIYIEIDQYIQQLKDFLHEVNSENYDFIYDQVVIYGELVSTTIVSAYLRTNGIENKWIDARKIIATNTQFRDAEVDWEETEKRIRAAINPRELSITQGFIASSETYTTTLGREGSDYTAGIIAYCLDAEEVCIWKDVDGVLNADPREFENTVLLEHLSYQETIELAFFGASVIHPKTLQPLQRKGISLQVKSFENPLNKGTTVSEGTQIYPEVPCFIVKKDLYLLSLSTHDFSFFMEENISEVFALFHKYQVKVHLIQNSAISFSVCIRDKFKKFPTLIHELQKKFSVSYNQDVCLFTIRHFNDEVIQKTQNYGTVLLKQLTRGTVQFVIKKT